MYIVEISFFDRCALIFTSLTTHTICLVTPSSRSFRARHGPGPRAFHES